MFVCSVIFFGYYCICSMETWLEEEQIHSWTVAENDMERMKQWRKNFMFLFWTENG